MSIFHLTFERGKVVYQYAEDKSSQWYFMSVLYYPIAGWLFQACIVFTRSRGVLPERRVAIPSKYCITRSRGATSRQYCISRAPGGYSKPILYYPFAGRLLQASIVSWIARWLFQASRVVRRRVWVEKWLTTRSEGFHAWVSPRSGVRVIPYLSFTISGWGLKAIVRLIGRIPR